MSYRMIDTLVALHTDDIRRQAGRRLISPRHREPRFAVATRPGSAGHAGTGSARPPGPAPLGMTGPVRPKAPHAGSPRAPAAAAWRRCAAGSASR
jgi:hypothetical protein